MERPVTHREESSKRFLHYFPVIPRLQRLYKSSHTAKEMTWHATGKCTDPGSIAEGYVAEEALTFSSHYFRNVTTQFNCPDRNVDCPPPTCQFQVFKSLCKLIGLRYVLHNSPEKETYRAKFKSEIPNPNTLKEEFPAGFGKAMLHGVMAVTVAVMIVPLHTTYPLATDCGGCLVNRGKGTRKPNLGGRRAGRQHTRQETRNLGLKAITDKSGPVPIRFEELVRELPLHYPSWRQVPPEQKAGVMARIGTQFDMRPHMESDRWPLIYAAIHQHLQKIYNGKKTALKERHWIPDSDETYDLERIRLRRLRSGMILRTMESSATRKYPSLIHTFFLTHTVNGVFLNPEDKALYEEMLRLQGLGSNTETGVPYTEDEIMAIVRGGKQRGHIPGVGRVLPGQGTVIPPPPPCTHSSDVVKLKKREKVLTRQVNMFMKLFRSDDKFSQMLTQLESQPEIGGGSGSGGRGDDEQGDDEDDGEDGEDEDDS
ncbi:reverse transcriptase domain-containing protein [Tanacetum coccineum]